VPRPSFLVNRQYLLNVFATQGREFIMCDWEQEGGELRYPEFGPDTYRPDSGSAVVFSCSSSATAFSPSPVLREREGPTRQRGRVRVRKIISTMPSGLARMSLFQNRRTRQPWFEPSRAANIIGVVRVLSAVGFDRHAMLDASEVEDERPKWVLAAELVVLQAPMAERRPQPPLGIGHLGS